MNTAEINSIELTLNSPLVAEGPNSEESVNPTDSLNDPSEPTAQEGFSVQDGSTANWVVRKIAEAREYAANVKQWASVEMRRAEREEEFFLFRFAGQLEHWLRTELAKSHTRRRSVSLPAGVVGLRTGPERLSITDRNATERWCEKNLPAAIRVTVSASGPDAQGLLTMSKLSGLQCQVEIGLGSLMDHHKQTGELPAGTALTRASEKFYVK